MPGAYTALKELSKDFDISVISAGYSPNLLNKNEWIKEYLPFVKHFIPVNLKEHKDKSNFNLSDGIFIDDEVKNLVTSDAPYKILFGQSQTWNGCWEGLKSNNWSDLKPMIYALALADNMEAKNESN